MASPETIHVALPDEAVAVFRPVLAVRVGVDRYRILEQPYDRATERWEFEPGTEVCVEVIAGADGPFRVARRLTASSHLPPG